MRTHAIAVVALLLGSGCRSGGGAKAEATDTAGGASADADGDGYAEGEDCDDGDAGVHPGAIEVCNGVDDDCDGDVDEDVTSTYYVDADGDGYGDPDAAVEACGQPAGFVADATDCDDSDPEVHPGAVEACNGVDDDCDGSVDEGATSSWYADADGDGYGDPDAAVEACEAPSGFVADATDCDDATDAVHPGADEVCDELDNDCDGEVDEGATTTFFEDADGDGWGRSDATEEACDRPVGYAADPGDCDDADASVHPGALEVCDGLDDDCDGSVDEADAVDASTWYADADGDGYGDASASTTSCSAPSGYVADDTDCDDSDASVHPGALEVCDGLDDDCDGSVDGTDAWWDASWPYRLLVTATAPSYDVAGPPIAVDVDFRDALDALGDSSAFDADTLRVVLQDCSLGQPELPSQFLDEWTGIFEKADPSDPAGDEAGAVVFLYDEDGDLSSLETFSAGSSATFGIYFGGSASAPSYSTDLAATASELSAGDATATFDDTHGGLLESLTLGSSPTLSSQTTSCCGNSIYTGPSGAGWTIDPQDGSGTLDLLEDGPVFAAVQATGSRSDSYGAYDYAYTYWMFAGRPELWVRTWQETTADTTNEHPTDFTYGIRPWESRQDDISSGATFTVDSAYEYADVSNGTWGLAFAYVQPPTYVVGISNYDPYLIVMGNDYAPYGWGTPVTVPAGTTYFDHVVMLVMPHEGSFSDVEDELFGLVEGVSALAGSPEAQ